LPLDGDDSSAKQENHSESDSNRCKQDHTLTHQDCPLKDLH
jgi:hypothetical protein